MAAALSLSMTATAFAADETITQAGGSTAPHNVTGTYVQGSEADTVYSVDVKWGSMEFTYTAAGEGTWDPATHAYDGQGEDPGWASTGNDITVTNHSNKAVTATLTFAPAAAYAGIAGSFTGNTNTLNLASAAEGESLNDVTKAPTASTALSLSGDPGTFEGSQTIGTVTVTIQ